MSGGFWNVISGEKQKTLLWLQYVLKVKLKYLLKIFIIFYNNNILEYKIYSKL